MIEEGKNLIKRMPPEKEISFRVGDVQPNKLKVKLYFWSTHEDAYCLEDDLTEAIIREFTGKNIKLGNIPESKKGYR